MAWPFPNDQYVENYLNKHKIDDSWSIITTGRSRRDAVSDEIKFILKFCCLLYDD